MQISSGLVDGHRSPALQQPPAQLAVRLLARHPRVLCARFPSPRHTHTRISVVVHRTKTAERVSSHSRDVTLKPSEARRNVIKRSGIIPIELRDAPQEESIAVSGWVFFHVRPMEACTGRARCPPRWTRSSFWVCSLADALRISMSLIPLSPSPTAASVSPCVSESEGQAWASHRPRALPRAQRTRLASPPHSQRPEARPTRHLQQRRMRHASWHLPRALRRAKATRARRRQSCRAHALPRHRTRSHSPSVSARPPNPITRGASWGAPPRQDACGRSGTLRAPPNPRLAVSRTGSTCSSALITRSVLQREHRGGTGAPTHTHTHSCLPG